MNSRHHVPSDEPADVTRRFGVLFDNEPPFSAGVTEAVDSAIRTARRRYAGRLAVAGAGAAVIAGSVVTVGMGVWPTESGTNVAAPPTNSASPADPAEDFEEVALRVAEATGREVEVLDVLQSDRDQAKIVVDFADVGPATITAGRQSPDGEGCEPAVGNVCEATLLPEPNSEQGLDGVMYVAATDSEAVFVDFSNWDERASKPAGSLPIRDLGVGLPLFREVVAGSGMLPQAEFPAPGPTTQEVEQLVADIAELADNAEVSNIYGETGYASADVEMDADQVYLSASELLGGPANVGWEECDDGRGESEPGGETETCEKLASGDGWYAWSTMTVDGKKWNETLTFALDTSFGTLDITVGIEGPEGGTELGDVGYTPEAIHDVVTNSGILE